MHVAFIAGRDQDHHDGVTAGTADDRARCAGVHAQLGERGRSATFAAAADDCGHLAADGGEQIAGNRVAVQHVGHFNPRSVQTAQS